MAPPAAIALKFPIMPLMPMRKDRCICLRKFEYSETSQILALFGRELGMFRVIAKGAHRRTKAGASRFDGGIDLLDLGDAVMTDPATKELATLTEWKQVDGHLELRTNQRTLYLALYAAELTGLMMRESDPHPELFDLLMWVLAELSSERAEESFVSFQLELLRQTGFMPELGVCVNCGQAIESGKVYFSPQDGGIVCRICPPPAGPRIATDARLIRILQTILKLPRAAKGIPQRLPKLTRVQTDPVNRLLAEYIRYTLGHDLRVAGFVM